MSEPENSETLGEARARLTGEAAQVVAELNTFADTLEREADEPLEVTGEASGQFVNGRRLAKLNAARRVRAIAELLGEQADSLEVNL